MRITDLPQELLLLILNYLCDMYKRRLLATNRHFRSLYGLVRFKKEILYDHIRDHEYIDSFYSVILKGSIFERVPKYLTRLVFDGKCDGTINVPKTVTSVVFRDNGFDQPIDNCIPNGVTHLSLICKYNYPLNKNCIPKSIQRLVLCDYDFSLNDCLPYGITHLVFVKSFNHSLRSQLPKSLISLSLSDNYNTPLIAGDLPESLKYLTLGKNFDQIDSVLPDGLTHLIFGTCYNKSIHQYPRALKELTFGHEYNKPLNALPASLICIKFGDNFNQPVDVLKNTNVRHVEFGNDFCQDITCLPLSCKLLHLGWEFNEEIDLSAYNNLKAISFGGKFNKPIDKLPPNLFRVEFSYEFDQPIHTMGFLTCLTYIEFGHNFNQPVDAFKSLTCLKRVVFGEKFNQPIDSFQYLKVLTHVAFGEEFNQPLNKLPPMVSYVSVCGIFDFYDTIPRDIIFLRIYGTYSCQFLKNIPEIVIGS
jgi:hypothetical protein